MAKMRGRFRAAAFSMLAVARVLPCSFAFCATSSSEIKQKTSPPSCASFRLLIPALAIWVSVTMQAPFCSARIPFATAPSEMHKLST